jgi:DNA-binding GntR family transcriptional regulator
MAASIRHFPATQSADLAELRLLIELPALRRLADRGLSDGELGIARNLAAATARAARNGDALGYLRADMVFHQYLLGLMGDPVLSELARLLLSPDLLSAPSTEESEDLMAGQARYHAELVGMLADGMVRSADHLLRLHFFGPAVGRTAVRSAEPTSPGAAAACSG